MAVVVTRERKEGKKFEFYSNRVSGGLSRDLSDSASYDASPNGPRHQLSTIIIDNRNR
jgi:hypothetical protein